MTSQILKLLLMVYLWVFELWYDRLRRQSQLLFWFFIDSTVNFHSLQQNSVLQIDGAMP